MKASKYFISDELRMQGWWKWQLLEQTTDIPDKERLPSFLQQCSRHALQSPQEIISKRLAFTCSGTFHTFYSLFFDDLLTVGLSAWSQTTLFLLWNPMQQFVWVHQKCACGDVDYTLQFCVQVRPVLPSPTLGHFLLGLVEDSKQNRTVSLGGVWTYSYWTLNPRLGISENAALASFCWEDGILELASVVHLRTSLTMRTRAVLQFCRLGPNNQNHCWDGIGRFGLGTIDQHDWATF